MCIYCPTDNYRKIYENHYGPIPKDDRGRSYEIHHVDGNRKNNEITNLKCLSIQEHYDIHYSQKDWGACTRIAAKMHLSSVEIGELVRKRNSQTVIDGTHPWLGKGKEATERNKIRVKNGTHNFLGGKIQSTSGKNRVANGTHPFIKKPDGSSYASTRTSEGRNPFSKRGDGTSIATDKLKLGIHPTQKQWNCSFCGVSGKGASNFSRYHGKCS